MRIRHFSAQLVLAASLLAYGHGAGVVLASTHTPPPGGPFFAAEPCEPEPDPSVDPLIPQAPQAPASIVFHLSATGRDWISRGQYHAISNASGLAYVQGVTTPAAHVLGANTGSVGVAVACGAGSTYVGPELTLTGGAQPTRKQLEDASAFAAEVAFKYRIPLDGWRRFPGGQVLPTVAGHHDYAKAFGYGHARLDPGGFLPQLKRAAAFYHAQLAKGARKPVWVK